MSEIFSLIYQKLLKKKKRYSQGICDGIYMRPPVVKQSYKLSQIRY